jgi:hypothetical protein
MCTCTIQDWYKFGEHVQLMWRTQSSLLADDKEGLGRLRWDAHHHPNSKWCSPLHIGEGIVCFFIILVRFLFIEVEGLFVFYLFSEALCVICNNTG